MTLQDIQQKLVRLTSIVDGWSEGRMNAIERDIALEHLRSIYESLSAATLHQQPSRQPCPSTIVRPTK